MAFGKISLFNASPKVATYIITLPSRTANNGCGCTFSCSPGVFACLAVAR